MVPICIFIMFSHGMRVVSKKISCRFFDLMGEDDGVLFFVVFVVHSKRGKDSLLTDHCVGEKESAST